ncbi:uncharacterized protein LOC110988012, partial [Acanthaster planci]|uniref:Uncharacterized protein LOC110988012 n=1 Tax=Acanthaster planci TaxID=133434 RepID=A0A8B7ZMU9_ACAPL
MKCIRVTAPKEPLVFLDNEPIPEAPDNGAVVKISYGGMCHSDVHFWNGDENVGGGKGLPLFKYPCIPGHEIAGVLFSLGDSATKNNESGLKPGDRVVVYPWIHCHACSSCKAGHGEFCKDETLLRLTSIGLRRDGGFAQFVAVPDVLFVVPVPAPIPLPVACLLPCSGVTAYHAVEEGVEFVKNVTEITGGCSVLTIGAGGVGQWGIRLARAMYPPETQIMCAEIKKEALDEVAGRVRGVEPFL